MEWSEKERRREEGKGEKMRGGKWREVSKVGIEKEKLDEDRKRMIRKGCNYTA